ncbi:unnamed protein product [Polarella glacialis]|uniref:Pentacotripeptide-repeat region of PRORP domain-containing protein n=1 Tax=Polarella glacialis TaxID=89957 RepID=A0A813FSJ2_POLGL|nr:unnamed protein product [Polarella glacialis]
MIHAGSSLCSWHGPLQLAQHGAEKSCLAEAIAQRSVPKGPQVGFRPRRTVFAILACGVCSAGVARCRARERLGRRVGFCRRLAQESPRHGGDLPFGSEQLDKFAKAKDVEAARLVYEQMLPEIQGYSDSIKRVVVNTMIKACSDSGDARSGEEFYDSLQTLRLQPNSKTYGKLIEAAAKSGNIAVAESWMNKLSTAMDPDRVHFSTMIDACAKKGDVARAHGWFAKMIDSVGLSDPKSDTAALSAVIEVYAQQGDPLQATHWLDWGCARRIAPDVVTFTNVLTAYSRKGDLSGAESSLQQMVSLSLKPTMVTYSSLIDACAKVGDAEKAESWFRKCLDQGLEPDITHYRAVLDAHVQSQNLGNAEHWLSVISSTGLQLGLIGNTVMVKAYAKAGDMDRVERLLGDMQRTSVECDDVLIGTVISGYADLGQTVAAERWFRQLRHRTVKGYTTLLKGYGKSAPRLTEHAVDLIKEMLAEGIRPNPVTLKTLERVLGRSRATQLCADLGIDSP